jgi:aromatic ring-opening dioxygenase LigB subunit
MPLVFAAIAPHGFPLIPDLCDDADGAIVTRAAMEELGRRAAAAEIESIVIAGPHGVRVDGAICLADTARAAGALAWQGRQVELNVPVNGPLTDALAAKAKERGIPIARAGYGGNRRDQSVLSLDWGILTPLWFLGHGRNMPGMGMCSLIRPRRISDHPRSSSHLRAACPDRHSSISDARWQR